MRTVIRAQANSHCHPSEAPWGPAPSNRTVILSEVREANAVEGPAVALARDLNRAVNECSFPLSPRAKRLWAPPKPMRTVILSEVREANAAEGPAVAFARFQTSRVFCIQDTTSIVPPMNVSVCTVIPAKANSHCHPERSSRSERSRRTCGCLCAPSMETDVNPHLLANPRKSLKQRGKYTRRSLQIISLRMRTIESA